MNDLAKQEILINSTAYEVRVAILEAGQLKEIHIERHNHQGIVGNIYKGTVQRVVPGMQAVFVDINMDRSAFLHLSDIHAYKEKQDIRDYFQSGQEIIVQVYKDALGTKGPRLTTRLGIPSRYLVLTPQVPEIIVSQKISDPALCEQLKNLLKIDEAGGYIIRTAAESATTQDILADQEYLKKIWHEMRARMKNEKVGIVYQELPIELRIIRDLPVAQIEKIRIDNPASLNLIRAFVERYMPSLFNKIEYHDGRLPIFELYSIDDAIQNLLKRKVYLRSGGYLIFDQTEAMTTIDVNTGSFLGQNNVEQTVYQTNLEAIKAIALQMRLRNLGGIIIIDLIDMNHAAHREKILNAFKDEIKRDPARVELHELTSLGLLQMTRKRTRESLEHVLCDICPTCEKMGFVKSIQTVCYDIFREIKRFDTIYAWKSYLIKASHEVIVYLQNEASHYKSNLEVELDKPIQLQVNSQCGREQFSILPWD